MEEETIHRLRNCWSSSSCNNRGNLSKHHQEEEQVDGEEFGEELAETGLPRASQPAAATPPETKNDLTSSLDEIVLPTKQRGAHDEARNTR